jgi:ribosomal protein S18 acetylase RimI-like enzyme
LVEVVTREAASDDDEWAMVKGAVAIELNVHKFNRGAISFYRKLGYNTVSEKLSKLLDRARAAG